MGLAEKRALRDFRDKQWVQIQSGFDQVLRPGQLEVVWEALAPDDSGSYLADTLTEGLRGLADGLKQVASDDLGREAIQETFKSIRVGSTDGGHIADAQNYALDAGVLHVKLNPRYQSGLTHEGVVQSVKEILETFL
jgi:hypothetical protein